MKVNEEKAKELLELADHWKKNTSALLNFGKDDRPSTDLGKLGVDIDALAHRMGKTLDDAAELIYETFPKNG